MFEWFKFPLARAQRQFTKHVLAKRHGAYHTSRDLGGFCHFCREETLAMSFTYEKESPAGERFKFRSNPIAFCCLRCQSIGRYSDGSGDTVHVSNWTPTYFSDIDGGKK